MGIYRSDSAPRVWRQFRDVVDAGWLPTDVFARENRSHLATTSLAFTRAQGGDGQGDVSGSGTDSLVESVLYGPTGAPPAVSGFIFRELRGPPPVLGQRGCGRPPPRHQNSYAYRKHMVRRTEVRGASPMDHRAALRSGQEGGPVISTWVGIEISGFCTPSLSWCGSF